MNFTFTSASVIGNFHQRLNCNNQDALEFYQDKNIIIGVVADGCGSGSNSEVGSRLSVNFVINFCRKHFTTATFDSQKLKVALIEYLSEIIKNQQTKEKLEFIENYLYFTLFGFVVQPNQTFIFHTGDGLYYLNEKEVIVEQNNQPKYIVKNLVNGNVEIEVDIIETSKLNRLLISTDGLIQLNERFLKNEVINGNRKIADFFDKAEYFDDIISLKNDLTDLSINRNILKDDTTLILLKRE